MKPAHPLHRPKPIRPALPRYPRNLPSTRYSLLEPVSKNVLNLDVEDRGFYELALIESEMNLRRSLNFAGTKLPAKTRWSYPFCSNAPKRPNNPMIHDKVFEDAKRDVDEETETDSSIDSSTDEVLCEE